MVDLQTVVIDEVSMLSPERIVHLHQRLCEIKGYNYNLTDNIFFGNCIVIAVGDLYQLPPVKAKAIYDKPNHPTMQMFNLWEQFKLYELTEPVRQQQDIKFAQLLNRIRVGEHTEEDVEVLKARELTDSQDTVFTKDLLHIYPDVIPADNHNDLMLKSLNSDEYISISEDSFPKALSQWEKNDFANFSRQNTGSLEYSVKLKVGARVMLVRNLDVADGLMNGALGTVSFCLAEDSQLKVVYVKFDNKNVGRNLLQQTKDGYAKSYSVIPVKRLNIEVPFSRSSGKLIVTRRQFPLILAWAITIHKSQSLTLENVVVDFKSARRVLQCGQIYVALSRVRSIENLYILNFAPQQIRANPKVKNALLNHPALTLNCKPKNTLLSVLTLNVAGYDSSKNFIENDERFLESDVICLQEMRLQNKSRPPEMNGYSYFDAPSNNRFQHKGVFMKSNLEFLQHYFEDTCQVIQILLDGRLFTVVSVYRRQALRVKDFTAQILNCVEKFDADVLLGDFNINCNSLHFETLEATLKSKNYANLNKNPTHRSGSCIDYIFVKTFYQANCVVRKFSVVFSDHDVIQCNLF